MMHGGNRIKEASLRQRILLFILGLFMGLFLLEVGLRTGGIIFSWAQEAKNISAIRQKEAYRIMCLGESTTVMVGDECYPDQLQDVLDRKDTGIKFSVINKGVPGTHTGLMLKCLEENLDRYDPDMVTVMMGINDTLNVVPRNAEPELKKSLFFRSLNIYKFFRILQAGSFARIKSENLRDSGDGKDAGMKPTYFLQAGKSYEKTEISEDASSADAGDYFECIELGKRYMQDGMYGEAGDLFRTAMDMAPEKPDAYRQMGWLYNDSLGDGEKAEIFFKRSIDAAPCSDKGYIDLGICFIDQMDYDRAAEAFKKAIALVPHNPVSYKELAMLYSDKIGNLSKAAEAYEMVTKLSPTDDKAWGFLALYYTDAGEYAMAEKCRAEAQRLRLDFYNPETLRNYHKLKKILDDRKIKLVCVQYPMRSVQTLKNMFDPLDSMTFVDNEGIFKEAVEKTGFEAYFIDSFAGDFGHCTSEGNRLLAENIAETVLKTVFGKDRDIFSNEI